MENHYHNQSDAPRLYRHQIILTLRKCSLLAALMILLLGTSTFAVVPQDYAVTHQFTSSSSTNNVDKSHIGDDQLRDDNDEVASGK